MAPNVKSKSKLYERAKTEKSVNIEHRKVPTQIVTIKLCQRVGIRDLFGFVRAIQTNLWTFAGYTTAFILNRDRMGLGFRVS